MQIYPGIGDNAFEGDNNKTNMDAQPRSAPTFYNATLIADPASSRQHRAMTIRRGSGGQFHNLILSGFNAELIDIRDPATAALIASGELGFSAVLAHAVGVDGFTAFPEETDDDGGFNEGTYFDASRLELVASAGLDTTARDIQRPRYGPSPVSFGLRPARVPQGEFWDEGANYFGAIRPGTVRDWTTGWTAFPAN